MHETQDRTGPAGPQAHAADGTARFDGLDLDERERAALGLAREFSSRVGRERESARDLAEYLRTRSAADEVDGRTGASAAHRVELRELPSLQVRVARTASGVVLCQPLGELDAGNSSQLETVLAEEAAGAPLLLVDLSAVPLLDSAALNSLLRARRRQQLLGGTLRVVSPTPSVQRVLTITGLVPVLLGDAQQNAHDERQARTTFDATD